MLTALGCAARRERLWGELAAMCDVLVVGDPSHLTYLAGYTSSQFVFRTVESGALLLLEPGLRDTRGRRHARTVPRAGLC